MSQKSAWYMAVVKLMWLYECTDCHMGIGLFDRVQQADTTEQNMA